MERFSCGELARSDVGEPMASVVYFYTLTAGDFTATPKNVNTQVITLHADVSGLSR